MTLEELIDSAMSDGILTRKEKKILFKKAKAEGYDLDEVKINLRSKLHEKRKTIWLKNKLLIIGGLSFFILFVGSILEKWDYITEKIEKKIYAISCGCENIDDCLSKYKFEEARKFATKLDSYERSFAIYKIICVESEYWIDQNEFQRAITSLNELANLDYNDKEELFIKHIDLSYALIHKLCQKSLFQDAIHYASQLPLEHTYSDGSYQFFHNRHEYDAYKEGLNKNQRIKKWCGTEASYETTTFMSPKQEALEIIEEYKNGK